MKNKFKKAMKIDNAYATYRTEVGDMYFEWKILKTWQDKDNEDKNPYARWYTACKSPMTYDSWEYGDAYIGEILETKPLLISATDEWKETYND
jgi:hypothetical protein|tara:strand:- start:298 stop:576 length:279 start_codon:yes stop_codon:yes gene_type:complete